MFFRNDGERGSAPQRRKAAPLLPLRDIVVFPVMVSQLFVGRDRSIAALDEAVRCAFFVLGGGDDVALGADLCGGDEHALRDGLDDARRRVLAIAGAGARARRGFGEVGDDDFIAEVCPRRRGGAGEEETGQRQARGSGKHGMGHLLILGSCGPFRRA